MMVTVGKMKEWAKAFYESKAWRRTREYINVRDNGLCARCGGIGEIVHHIKYLTPQNIGNVEISLNPENLELVCRECHGVEHEGELPIENGLMFDSAGNVVEKRGDLFEGYFYDKNIHDKQRD